MLENLGATEDQFDTIDVSHNELRAIDNVPRLARLTTLMASHNKIARVRARRRRCARGGASGRPRDRRQAQKVLAHPARQIAGDIGQKLPALESLVLLENELASGAQRCARRQRPARRACLTDTRARAQSTRCARCALPSGCGGSP